MIYLDNSATTYPKPECLYKALDFANRNLAFNAGRGNYKEANDLCLMINETRQLIADFVGMNGDSVVFTSSATESLNMIIYGLGIADGDIVYISPFEHNAIVRPLYNLQKTINFEIVILPFDKSTWHPEIEKIEGMFSIKKPKAVLVSQISNVTGLMLDYKTIFDLSKKYGAINVLDSAQAFGVVNPEMKNVDYCVFAGHKSLYASFGIAGFIVNTKEKLAIFKAGGNGSDSLNHDMPFSGHARYEAGSPNSVAIYGLNSSIKWLKENDVHKHENELTSYLINQLKQVDKIKLYLPENVDDIFGIVSINIEGYTSDDIATILYEDYGIMVRSGYHCSPFVHEFIGSLDNKGTVRISLGAFNTKKEIDFLICGLKEI